MADESGKNSSVDNLVDGTIADENSNLGRELENLLVKNGCGTITPEEAERALDLIQRGVDGTEDCILCIHNTPYEIRKAIAGSSYCSGHAYYLLVTKK